MSSMVKTTEEFSTVRKVRYGVGNGSRGGSPLSAKAYTLSSASSSAALSPHKHFYATDQDGQRAYFIEFNIGEFQFDEITIRTEGQRLIVQGKSKLGERADPEEVSREFKRDFTLPSNVDPYSIKAQLDEATRQLSLIGKVSQANESNDSASRTETKSYVTSSYNSGEHAKVGTIKENRSSNSIEYEIYLGNDLKEGKASVELSSYNNLLITVNNRDWDKYGDYGIQLNRQIKLPQGADAHQISHGIDSRRACLLVKLPIKS